MARSQYELPKSRSDDPRGMEPYIRETAQKYGVDPEVAVRVAKSEGLRQFNSGVRQKNGKEEPSWGAFQLYTGGGLGNKFQKETGLDPSDPANEKATIDYALRTAAKVGWGPWHGAKNTGIGEFEGIGGNAATPEKTAATAAGATPVSEGAPAVSDASQTATAADTGGYLDKLKDPKGTASAGLGEAISGLGQAVAGTGLNKDMYATTSARPTVAATPASPTPTMVPMVDPRVVEGQRQQLAMAMQRLNSGRLY